MAETPVVTKNQAYKETFQRGTVVFPLQYSMCNTVDSHYDLPLHWHDEFELIHILSGTYNIFLGDKVIELNKNDLCLIPGDLIHGDAPNKGMALYESVVFDIDFIRLHSYSPDSFFSDVLNGSIILDNFIPASKTELCDIGCKFFNIIKLHIDDYDLITAGLLLLFFGNMKKDHLYRKKSILQSRTKDIRTDQISKVLNLIRKNYGQELTLQQMADSVALSPKYFCRLFKENTGHTPIEYLNWFRVNRACTLLRETSEKLLDIALECGFNDFSYFTKIFRRYKGMPPSKYRTFDPAKAQEVVIDPEAIWLEQHPEEVKSDGDDETE
ncbi:AraC family transcriptional regulator [uncultured Treponema sp.]|uniref:AraC family transcriptional regulator n=1 Tax=uncultured Treponema sp. TaxID=162155 RepID=UPI0025F0F731|nr:AraC family transcriptional regulator [uncultured Treponema sp.]